MTGFFVCADEKKKSTRTPVSFSRVFHRSHNLSLCINYRCYTHTLMLRAAAVPPRPRCVKMLLPRAPLSTRRVGRTR